MSRANKTARISTGGYYPPRGSSMEPHEEEEPQEEEVDSPAPAPTPEPFQLEPDKEESKEVEVVVLSDDDDEVDAVQEDEPIPPLGWTTKVWYKPRCESSVSHHDLWGFFRPTTLIGMQLWSTSAMSIRTLWRTLIGRPGCASPLGMNRRTHISLTQTMRITLTVPPWKIA